MIEALSDNASLLIFIVVFLVAITVLKEFVRPGKSRRTRFRRKSGGEHRAALRIVAKKGEDEALASASEQLRRVMAADFKSRALLNHSESQVFKARRKGVHQRLRRT